MEFLTSAILAGAVYDAVKYQAKLTVEEIKEKLKAWALSDSNLESIVSEVDRLKINNQESASAIEKKLISSPAIMEIIGQTKAVSGNFNQHHTGSGNNVMNFSF